MRSKVKLIIVVLFIIGATGIGLMTYDNEDTIATGTEDQIGEIEEEPSDDRENEGIVEQEKPIDHEDEETTENEEEVIEEEPSDGINDEGSGIDMDKDYFAKLVGDYLYNFTEGSVEEIENPGSIYMLVNKKNALSSEYVPEQLIIPNVPFTFDGYSDKKNLREVAAIALEQIFSAAKEEGHNLFAISGYRSYSTQKSIFEYNVNQKGEEEANKVSARPGQSEHQTGLAMDISSASAGFGLVESFGNVPEGQWVAANAHKFGFIIRYPKDKTEITQYLYEPWHLRYVGIELATYLYEYDLTLDEFYDKLINQ